MTRGGRPPRGPGGGAAASATPRALCCLCAAAAASSAAAGAGAPAVRLEVERSTGAFAISHGDKEWFRGSEYRLGGLSSSAGTLVLSGTADAKGEDALGAFSELTLEWSGKDIAGGALLQTSFRRYPALPGALVFEQRFPRELDLRRLPRADDVGTLFPAFEAVGPAGSETPCFAYHDLFAKLRPCTVATYNTSQQGVPFVAYDAADAALPMAVLSPLDNPTATSMYKESRRGGVVLGMGLRSGIEVVPLGWRQSFVMSMANGINDGMMAWGDLMLRRHGVDRVDNRYRDDVHGGIGFWTDNGGFYHYNIGNNKSLGSNYEEVLPKVKAYHDALGVPFRHWQLDSWFYPKHRGATGPSGVVNWTALPSVFPRGVPFIQTKLRLPLVIHNRFFAPDTDYAKSWTDIDWYVSNKTSIPKDPNRFFERFFRQQEDWGLSMYEQDWMNVQFQESEAMMANISLSDLWLSAMASRAAAANLTIQYCMPLPAQVLASAAFPAVTNIRASDDYMPGDETWPQWQIGNTAMLLWALGKLPFKDGFFSSSLKEPSSPFPGPEIRSDRAALMASMSAAMVAPVDGIYLLNASRVLATCRADGIVLKPERPLTTPDACFRRRDPLCNVYTTYSEVEGYGRVHYYFRNNGSEPLLAEEIAVVDRAGGTATHHVVYNWYARSLSPLEASTPLSPGYEGHIYALVAPVVAGWVLLGEPSKYIATSSLRFRVVVVREAALAVDVRGAAGEAVEVCAARRGDAALRCRTVAFGARGGVRRAVFRAAAAEAAAVPVVV